MNALRNTVFCVSVWILVVRGQKVLPATSNGLYCGCKKAAGRCIRSGSATGQCVYKNCDIYKCDRVQTGNPELICLQKFSPRTLVASSVVDRHSTSQFPCALTPIGHTFVTFYANGVTGSTVDWRETARRSLVVRLAAGGDTSSQVQTLASAVAKLLTDQNDRDAASTIHSVSSILAAQTGFDQDLIVLDPSRATLAQTSAG